MIPASNQQHQEYIEIPLFKSGKPKPLFYKVLIKMGVGILICIIVLHYLLGITDIILLITGLSLVAIIIGSYEYFDHLFPRSIETLIIAYGEIHLLDNEAVKWYQPIGECEFKKLQEESMNEPMIKILDKKQFSMVIQYMIPMNIFSKHSCDQSNSSNNYIIYSKSKWNRLLNLLN